MVEMVTNPTSNTHKLTFERWLNRGLIFASVLVCLFVVIMLAYRLMSIPSSTIMIGKQGLNQTQYQQLSSQLAGITQPNFFTADLQQIRDTALTLPWVEQVSVVRQWSDGIKVTALPKQAIARFGSERLLDSKGNIFVPTSSGELANTKLVQLYGDETHTVKMMQYLQLINTWAAPLGLNVKQIVLTSRMTWLIQFNTGLRIVVDRHRTGDKLSHFFQLAASQLKPYLPAIQSVDLRYRNGMAISWKLGTPPSKSLEQGLS